MFNFIRTQYRLHRLTAAQVWEAADNNRITKAQAVVICGPRPSAE